VIITNSFVLLNFPRTGTTFARDALRRLYEREVARSGTRLKRMLGRPCPSFREVMLPIKDTIAAEQSGRISQHGAYWQIPAEARRLPVVSIVRNPFDWIVSNYEYKFWQHNPIWNAAELAERYPGYPDLTFPQYVAMMDEYQVRNLLKGKPLKADVGPLTLRFLRFYGRDPERMVDQLTDESIDTGRVIDDLGPVEFLHTESLNVELCNFLGRMGFSAADTQFIMALPAINIANSRGGKSWTAYCPPDLEAGIRQKERLLFMRFPEYASPEGPKTPR